MNSNAVPGDESRVPPFDSVSDFRRLPRRTSSAATFRIIDEWLHDCQTTHETCASSNPEHGADRLSGIRFLNITQTSVILIDDACPQRYMSLSHCWGSTQSLPKTTRSTYNKHITSGIPLVSLPKTFRDAVRICQNLKVDFLWIDSLCIIQDDRDDWAVQASRMAEVYKSSYLNIAASASKGPHEGCFRTTDLIYRGERLPGFANMMIRKKPPIGLGVQVAQNEDSLPLMSRAWVYQEVLLAPRTIHFGPQEVVWQCKSVLLQQSGSTFQTSDLVEMSAHAFPISYLDKQSFKCGFFRSAQYLWYRQRQDYSRRRLTYHSDRLPALAALAGQMVQIRQDDRYVAGLWRETLLYDLGWIIQPTYESGDMVVMNSSPTNVPTWSWSHIEGPIRWPSSPEVKVIDCVWDVEVVSQTNGPIVSGVIEYAAITLVGCIVPVHMMQKYVRVFGKIDSDTRQSILDGMHSDSSGSDMHTLVYDRENWSCPSVEQHMSDIHTFVIPLTRLSSLGRSCSSEISVLLVRPWTRAVDPSHTRLHKTAIGVLYRRVGIASLLIKGEVAARRTLDFELTDAASFYENALQNQLTNMEKQLITLL